MKNIMLITGGSRGIGAAPALLAAGCFLCARQAIRRMSDKASFSTGTFIDVAGGR